MKTLNVFNVLILLPISINCFANEKLTQSTRSGYSFFGAGFDFLDYEESTTRNIAGSSIDIETSTGLNLTQQSGAYVSINNKWGFYLITASTLGESSSDEDWQINKTTVRTNKVVFERQRLGFVGTYQIKQNDFILLGTQYSSTEFKRFAAALTPSASDFGIDENTFSAGAVSENVWDLSLVAGYEVNTIFNNKNSGWRYQWQLLAGLPLITQLNNTDISEGESFRENFSGFQIRANWVYGYQFNENIMAAFSLEVGISKRSSISNDVTNVNDITEFPENTIIYIYPSATVYWSF